MEAQNFNTSLWDRDGNRDDGVIAMTNFIQIVSPQPILEPHER